MSIGFVVNPLAGSGGPLALKGSDSIDPALASGSDWAEARAIRALAGLAGRPVRLLAGAGPMGETAAAAAGLAVTIVHRPAAPSTGADTTACVRACVAAGADLILFVGGDGTARDVLAAAPAVPVLGVPAGVKMHSGVFAPSPATAAAILADLADSDHRATAEAEVIDRDADGHMHLYGRLPVLAGKARQAAKAAGPDADTALAGAVAAAAALVRAEPLCFIGPGLTMLALKRALGSEGTMLGVDVFAHGRPVLADATQAQLLDLAHTATPRLVLGVVGGQGYLLGRGNQQLGRAVLARAGWPPMVLASAAKLAALPGGRLLVDTGDEALDQHLAGHVQVRTGPRQSMMMRIDAA